MVAKQKKLIVIEVLGGLVAEVTMPGDLENKVEVWVCDWDNIEGLINCPHCGNDGSEGFYADKSARDYFICNGCNKSFRFNEWDDYNFEGEI